MSGWIVLAGSAGFALFALIGLVRPWRKVTWGRTGVRVSRLGYLAVLLFLVPLVAVVVVEHAFDIDPGGAIVLAAVGVALASWVMALLVAGRDIRRDPGYQQRQATRDG